MLITRETDYALRILYSLLDGEKKSVGDISKAESIPQQFAYKIMKKLSQYDLITIMEGGWEVNACMDPNYQCSRRNSGGCLIHSQLIGIQQTLNDQLRSYSLLTLLTGS